MRNESVVILGTGGVNELYVMSYSRIVSKGAFSTNWL